MKICELAIALSYATILFLPPSPPHNSQHPHTYTQKMVSFLSIFRSPIPQSFCSQNPKNTTLQQNHKSRRNPRIDVDNNQGIFFRSKKNRGLTPEKNC
jgi:hypothetical protein